MSSLTIKLFLAGLIGGIAALVGGFDRLFQTLAILMAIDLITGIAAAWKEGKLSSNKGWLGTVRKLVTMLLIVLAVKLDELANTGGAIRSAVVLYFIANEGLSVFENSGRLGIPLPPQLKKVLLALKESSIRKNKE